MNNRAWLILALLSLFWGGSFLYYELSLEGFQPFTVVLLRVGIGALMLGVLYAVRRESWKLLAEHWRLFLILGIFNVSVPFAFFAWGQQYIDSALASILNAATPIPTILLAALVGQERFNLIRLGGALFGFVGVGILFIDGLNVGGNQLLGSFLALMPAFFYAIGSVISRRYSATGISSLGYATGTVIVATVITLPFSFILEQPWTDIPTEFTPWFGAIAIGSIGTAFAYPLYYYLIRSAGATNTTLVTMLVPIIATIAGVVVLNEVLGYTFFIGSAVILVALVVLDGRAYEFIKKRFIKPT